MAVAVALWSIALKPGTNESIIPQSDLRITNVALGDELASDSKRTSVKFTYTTPTTIDSDDEDDAPDAVPLTTTVLCSLTPGKIEQATVDVVLESDEEFLFEVVGPNTVYLTGNYIDQTPPDQVPFNDDSEPDSDEEVFDLRTVSSDVELNPDELEIPSDDDADRFEEVQDGQPVPKAKKRPRESEADEQPEAEGKVSKSQKKKLNKKLKAEDGKVVPAGEDAKAPATEEKTKEKEKKKKEKPTENGTTDMQVLSGGVKIKDVKLGAGPKAKKGSQISMRYIGKLDNGKIFDQNTKGQPFSVKLGVGEVIKGWDVGIEGMQVGGERLIIIPPKMGYGKQKIDKIPANSTLTFEVKLIQLK